MGGVGGGGGEKDTMFWVCLPILVTCIADVSKEQGMTSFPRRAEKFFSFLCGEGGSGG